MPTITLLIHHPANPTNANLLSQVATPHAACITNDKTIASFMPPLSHEKILNWWTRFAKQTSERVIILCLVSQDDERCEGVKWEVKGDVKRDVAGVVMLYIPTT
jgi:hypothetical protein